MLKRAGIRVFFLAGLIACGLLFAPSGYSQTALPPQASQAFSLTTIPQNGTTVLTITLSNPNADMALNFVAFNDQFPLGLTTPFPFAGNNACGGIVFDSGDGIQLSNVVLGPSASCTFSTSVTGTTPGVKTNSFTVKDLNAGTGNTSTATVDVVSPPTISEAFNQLAIAFKPGGTFPFFAAMTITLTNPNATGAEH